MMRLYTISRQPGGKLQLLAEAEVTDKDQRGRVTGSHVETDLQLGPFDIGNSSEESKALALAIMRHYYGASATDAGATAEAERKATLFLNAFLIHHALSPGARLQVPSNVIDRWANLL